jgi:hypothetical protein
MNSMNSCMEEYVRASLDLRPSVDKCDKGSEQGIRPQFSIVISNTGKIPLQGVSVSVSIFLTRSR